MQWERNDYDVFITEPTRSCFRINHHVTNDKTCQNVGSLCRKVNPQNIGSHSRNVNPQNVGSPSRNVNPQNVGSPSRNVNAQNVEIVKKFIRYHRNITWLKRKLFSSCVCMLARSPPLAIQNCRAWYHDNDEFLPYFGLFI